MSWCLSHIKDTFLCSQVAEGTNKFLQLSFYKDTNHTQRWNLITSTKPNIVTPPPWGLDCNICYRHTDNSEVPITTFMEKHFMVSWTAILTYVSQDICTLKTFCYLSLFSFVTWVKKLLSFISTWLMLLNNNFVGWQTSRRNNWTGNYECSRYLESVIEVSRNRKWLLFRKSGTYVWYIQFKMSFISSKYVSWSRGEKKKKLREQSSTIYWKLSMCPKHLDHHLWHLLQIKCFTTKI